MDEDEWQDQDPEELRKSIGKRPRPCGNPTCSCSTGITDQITYGHGKLDVNGFWEFPCRICAAHFEKKAREIGLDKEYPNCFPYWPTRQWALDNGLTADGHKLTRGDRVSIGGRHVQVVYCGVNKHGNVLLRTELGGWTYSAQPWEILEVLPGKVELPPEDEWTAVWFN